MAPQAAPCATRAATTSAVRGRDAELPVQCREPRVAARSYSLADPDREAASCFDGRRHQPIAWCLLRTLLQTNVTMVQFVLSEAGQHIAQRGLALIQPIDLAGVMRVDRFLDRDRAGHRRAFAKRCGRCTQCEGGEVTYGLQRSDANSALNDQFGELVQMLTFLLLHLAQRRCRLASA